MSSELPMIRVEGLGKKYKLGNRGGTYNTLRERIGGVFHRGQNTEESEFWALRDVSFEVPRGEILGMIGRNGAGKTTLLKLLSRITAPTEGRAEIRGRVGSLLEVGTGFHPELSGRENLYLSSAILGMRKSEIDQRLDEIVEFAEIKRFLDTPIKRYSSGMRVRLAFSVAAHLDPDVLLVDEVLAVGDFAFQNKCLGKMGSLHDSGRTILLVSHDLSVIRRLATRVLWIDGGKIAGLGPTIETIGSYLESGSNELQMGGRLSLSEHAGRSPRFKPVFQEIRLGGSGDPGLLPMGSDLEFELHFQADQELHDLNPILTLEDREGIAIYSMSSKMAGGPVPQKIRAGVFRFKLEAPPLNPGVYYLTLRLLEGRRHVDMIERACSFEVVGRDVYGTGEVMDGQWGFLSWPSIWQLEDRS